MVSIEEIKLKSPYVHVINEENSPLVVNFGDSFNFDAFSRLRVSEVTSLLEITHVHDKNSNRVDEVVVGTATSSLNLPNSCINLSVTSSGDYIIRQSKYRPPYQPGKGQLCEFTFNNFQKEAGVVKRVGYFSSDGVAPYSTSFDGFFLESDGDNDITFQMWHTGSLIYSASEAEWGNQSYVTTLDWSKTQLAFTDFQWLGVGRVRFGMVHEGLIISHASSSGVNNLDSVYMTSPSQPIRYEIRSSGGTGSFDQICSQVSMEGAVNSLYQPFSVISANSASFATANVKYPFIGVKMEGGYSNISPIINSMNVLSTSNDDYYLTVEINPTLSDTIPFTSSAYGDYSFAIGEGSVSSSADGTIIYSAVGASGQAYSLAKATDNAVKPGKAIDGTVDELWVCITPLGNTSTFVGSINYQYFS